MSASTRTDCSDRLYAGEENSCVLSHVPKDARRVLDLGSGAGANARSLAASGCVVDCVTISPAEAEALEKLPNIGDVYVHDLEDGLPEDVLNRSYDAVLASHVLEHLRKPAALLEAVRSLMGPDSVLIVALPNLFYYVQRFRLLRGHFEYTDSGLMDSTHVRWFTFKSAGELLRTCGFRMVAAYGEGKIPLPLIRRVAPARWLAPLDRWGSRTWPGLFGYQLIYCCRAACRP